MFENIGFSELLMIGVVVMLLFGARRLPEIGQSLGQGIREFKKSLSGIADPPEAPPREQVKPPEGEPRRLGHS